MEALVKRQIRKKLLSLQEFKKISIGVPSWTRYLRKALGMTSAQLAHRMGIAPSSLYQLERKEADSSVTLQSLKKAAQAMECELVYAFVPKRPIDEVIDEQALKRSKEIVKASHLHMEYEDQAVTVKELKDQVNDMAETLKGSTQLWDRKDADD